MRGVGLTLVTSLALACALPPADSGQELEVAPAREQAPAPVSVTAEPPPTELDRSLARARGRVRGGNVPEATRRELVASADPDHRHAARLLQAIAGEPPAEVFERTGGSPSRVELRDPDPRAEPELEPPSVAIEPTPVEPTPTEPAPNQPELDPGPIETHPKLDSLVPGSPAWAWFATGLVPLEAATPVPIVDANANIELDTLLGELPLLLREPPTEVAQGPRLGTVEQPRLVILTRLALHSSSPASATLELAGAGAVEVAAQPLTGRRVRLWMLDAGAVPGFLSARPTAAGLEVVDVVRRGRRLEIVVELGPGWWLREVGRIENGASVEFERFVGP